MSGYIGTQPVPQATQTRDAFTATNNQTSFPTSGYTPEFLDVFLNGVKLAASDYTATNGSDVVLAAGATTGDILEVVSYGTFEVLNPTFDGNVTFTGNASFGDNDKAIFGDGSDLQIYHDGTHSYVADAGGGSLVLSTNGSTVSINTDGPENMAIFRKDSSVDLFHNNSKKFETTSTGVTVTGTVAATAYTGDGSALTGTGSPSIDDNGNATAITIDSNEKVLIGKTSAGYNVDGFEAHPNGETYVSRSGTPMAINRNSSDGTFLNFYKDGSTVGNIGKVGTGFEFNSSSIYTHLTNNNKTNSSSNITWIQGNTNPWATNYYDLGNATYKWKDAYIGGGIYLGGNGSANKLDDYEEGTWTPAGTSGVGFASNSAYGTYTKIGNVVTLHATLIVASNSSSAHFRIDALPFNQSSGNAAAGFYMRYTSDSTYRMFYISTGNTIDVYNLGGGATTFSSVSTGRYDFSGVYYTDS